MNQLIQDATAGFTPAAVTTACVLTFTIGVTVYIAEDKAANIIRMQCPAVFVTAWMAATLSVRSARKSHGAIYSQEPAIAHFPIPYPASTMPGRTQRLDVAQLVDQASQSQPQPQSSYELGELDVDKLLGQRAIGGED
jgi:hypothetical protein